MYDVMIMATIAIFILESISVSYASVLAWKIVLWLGLTRSMSGAIFLVLWLEAEFFEDKKRYLRDVHAPRLTP